MSRAIPNTTLADDYTEQTTFDFGDKLQVGFFTIANNPAIVQLGARAEGTFPSWSAEAYYPPGTYPIAAGGRQPLSGIRAKNAVAGSPVQFFGVVFYPGEASVGAGTPFDSTVASGGGITPPGSGGLPSVGDYKFSAQAATHADPSGTGTWYLCDGTALPGAEVALIALVGASTPDARGRATVAKGTHADVDTIGDNDGVAVASRRPKHSHPATGLAVSTATTAGSTGAAGGGANSVARGDNTLGDFAGFRTQTISGQVGPATAPVDSPAYIVPGGLFVYGSGV